MSEQLNLAQRIAKASATVGGKLQTDKKNKQDNYDYISSDKILAVVGQAMADCGVVVFPAVVEHDLQLGQSAGGKTRYDVRVKFDMTISDGVSTMTMPWFGVGADYAAPDKATYKAITSGHKYFLAKLFCIGVGNEDSEHESEEPAQSAQQAKRQPQVVEQKKATMPAEKKEEEVKPWLDWKDGNAAKKAAIENGWCGNDFEAKNSLLNSLEAITGQKEQWQPGKQSEVFHHFYDKHMKRKGELKEAA